MSTTEIKAIKKGDNLLNKEINIYQAAGVFIIVILLVTSILYAVGQKHFWNPTVRTPQERGLNYYQALVDAEPNKPGNWVDLGWYYYQVGDYESALDKQLYALEIDPSHPGALFNAGLTYLQMSDLANAVDYLSKAAASNPYFWEGHLTLGIALISLEEYELAEKAIYDALELNKHSSEVYFHLGYVAEKKGETGDAVELYLEVLRYNPEHESAKEALDRLNLNGNKEVGNDEGSS